MKRFILLMLAFCALAPFCQKQTDGFAVGKISTLLLEGSSCQATIPQQTYRYLGKGGQSYVFVSEDGQTVLKLFRSSRLNTLKFFFPFMKGKIEQLENAQRQTFQSYLIADAHLKKETGLVALHLDHTPHAPIQIVDKLGIVHTLENCPFVIQQRAILVKEKLAQLIKAGKKAEANEALAKMNALIQHRIDLGIFDGDPNLIKNFGFCGDRPIQIDGGRFSFSPISTDKLESSQKELLNWIEQQGGLDEAI